MLTHMRELDDSAVKLQADIDAAVRAKVTAAAEKVRHTLEPAGKLLFAQLEGDPVRRHMLL